MFKNAYVRGIQNVLIQGGHVSYPNETSATKVADYIAERVDIDLLKEGGELKAVPKEVTAKIAGHLIDASKEFQKTAGYKPGEFPRIASLDDLGKVAHQHALDLMQKAAEGSTIEGGDKGNKEPQSPQAEAKMDNTARPQGYAEDSRGRTDVDTRPGAVGKEQEHPNKPAEGGTGSGGSPVEQSKTSSLEELVRKVAAGTGSTIMGGDKGNKKPNSAEGKMDEKQRPPGYAVLPNQGDLGELMRQFGAGSHVGKETTQHPNAPSRSPGGSNSVIETSHKSAAQEDPYLALFNKTAEEVLPYLPAVDDDAKVAHVRACMGMTTAEKAHYLTALQKTAADHTVAQVPPGSRSDGYSQHNSDATHSREGAYDGRKGNQGEKKAELPDFLQQKMEGEKKPDEKKPEEKKPDEKEEKKEASLADHIRRITAAQAAAQKPAAPTA